jgi:hypothetical protein
MAPIRSDVYTSASDTGSRQHVSTDVGGEVDESYVGRLTPPSKKSQSPSAHVEATNDTRSTSSDSRYMRRSTRSNRYVTRPHIQSDLAVPKASASETRCLRSRRQLTNFDKDTIAVARPPEERSYRSANTEEIVVASRANKLDAARPRKKRKVATS